MSRKIKLKKMEKSKVDMYIGLNAESFKPQDLMVIKDKLEKMDDDKFYLIQGIELQKPSTIFLIAIILGWERFWLGDVGLGILKIVTFYGVTTNATTPSTQINFRNGSGVYYSTTAITSITIFPNSGNFTSGTAYLYGVK